MTFYSSSDYAGAEVTVDGNVVKFYYGYEVEDPLTEEWMFQCKVNNEVKVELTTSELEKMFDKRDFNKPMSYLLAGILVSMKRLVF